MVYFTQPYLVPHIMIVRQELFLSDILIICVFILNRQKQKASSEYCSVMNFFHIQTLQIMAS